MLERGSRRFLSHLVMAVVLHTGFRDNELFRTRQTELPRLVLRVSAFMKGVVLGATVR